MEVRVVLRILHNGRYREVVEAVIGVYHPADGIGFSEVFPGHGFADNNGVGRGQSGGRVALDEGHVEYVKERLIRPIHLPLVISPLLDSKQPAADGATNPDSLLHAGHLRTDQRCQWAGRPRGMSTDNPVDAIRLIMVAIIAQLILDIEPYQYRAGHTDGKSKNIEKGITSVPGEAPEADYEVVFKHVAQPLRIL